MLFRGDATFGQILDRNRGAGPGFDLLRMGLAVSIYISHCSMMAGNHHLLSNLLASLFHVPHTDLVQQGSAAAGGAGRRI